MGVSASILASKAPSVPPRGRFERPPAYDEKRNRRAAAISPCLRAQSPYPGPSHAAGPGATTAHRAHPQSQSPWGLLAAARGEAYGTLWTGLVAIPVGALITVLGGFFVFGLIVGPILILGGLVAIPIALLAISDPTRHEDIRRLGRNAAERNDALARIEATVFGERAWAVPLSPHRSGPVLRVADDWIVLRSENVLRILSKRDALWFYGRERRRRKFGFVYASTYTLCVKTRSRAGVVELPMERHQAEWLMPHLHAMVPHALFGYSPQIERLSTLHLAAEVDRRRHYAMHA